MSLYLVGGSGIPNFGDELIAESWLNFISQSHGGEKVILDVKDVRASKQSLTYRENVKHTSHVRRLALESKKSVLNKLLFRSHEDRKLTVWEEIARGRSYFKNGSTGRRARFEREIRSISRFHIFGGGYINSRWPVSAFLIGLGVAIKEETGASVFATGLGLMPWVRPEARTELAMAREISDTYDIFEVRDADSARVCGIPRVMNGVDDAFLSPAPILRHDAPRTMHFAISFTQSGFEAFAKKLLEHARLHWAPEVDRILFWNNAPMKDLFALKKIKEYFPKADVFNSVDMKEMPIEFGRNDFMIATRFHPHLMAARCGIPGYYIQNNRYYSIKHKSILALGSGFSEVLTQDLPVAHPTCRGSLSEIDSSLHVKKMKLAHKAYGSLG